MFIAYLAQRFFWRIYDFLKHWYIAGNKEIFNIFISILEELDYKLALKANLRHFFEPMYKDYSLISRILSLFFRSSRILIALISYFILFVFALIIILVWSFIPVALLILAIFDFKLNV